MALLGFPRAETQEGVINSIDECLKSRSKIYHLPSSSTEVRLNDYNPLLLLIWQVNIDIQYTAESSLAVAHYVTGYVTKGDSSRMQELWQEVCK